MKVSVWPVPTPPLSSSTPPDSQLECRPARWGAGRHGWDRIQIVLPEHPRTDPAVAAARDSAGMMATTVETAGGGGGDRHTLPVAGQNAWRKDISGTIIDRQRLDIPSRKPKKCVLIFGIVIESSERPAKVVGARPSGKFRPRDVEGRLPHAAEKVQRHPGRCAVPVQQEALCDEQGRPIRLRPLTAGAVSRGRN